MSDQETMDWAKIPADGGILGLVSTVSGGPEALAVALVDATGRQKGWGDVETPGDGLACLCKT